MFTAEKVVLASNGSSTRMERLFERQEIHVAAHGPASRGSSNIARGAKERLGRHARGGAAGPTAGNRRSDFARAAPGHARHWINPGGPVPVRDGAVTALAPDL